MRFQLKLRLWLVLVLLNCLEPVQGSVINHLDDYDGLTPRQKGVVLINELGCVSCHATSQSHFKPRQGPDLSNLTDRVKVDWVKNFFNSSNKNTSLILHSEIPTMFEGSLNLSRTGIEKALTHFLISQSSSSINIASDLEGVIEEGESLYHSIGCAVCHGASSTDQGAKWIGSVKSKYTIQGLQQFLLDPLKIHPDARMPDMHLTHGEALNLTEFLTGPVDVGTAQDFSLLSVEIEKGKQFFEQLQCNACHDGNWSNVNSKIPSLESLRLDHGCLSTESGPWPRFTLSKKHRSWMNSALKTESQWTPSEKIQIQLTQFNCFACHERDDIGGVSLKHESLFTSFDPNLGEQGRLPPSLNGVGAKLNPVWIRKILVQGAKSRPYMKTRMPRFGPVVLDELMELFTSVDSKFRLPEIEMPRLNDTRRAGRDLAGTKGMACVTCHAFKGTKTGAMAAVDMSLMGQRLTREWFHHYLAEPQRFSPGTLMPDFWPKGHSTKPDILDGNAQKQIEALWVYLSDGYSLGAPAGLHREPMRLLANDQEAVMLRRSYPIVGKRGIGVGLPHGHNYVFNADKLGVAMLWKGEFADPSGVWLSQGHGRVRPLARQQISFPNQPQWFTHESKTATWPKSEKRPSDQQFLGYRLDGQRIPTFLYDIDGAKIEDTLKENESDDHWTLQRSLKIKKNTDLKHLILRVAVAEKIETLGQSQFQLGDELRIAISSNDVGYIVESPEGDELRIEVDGNLNVKTITLSYAF